VPKVVVPVKEEILRAAERRKAAEGSEGIAQFLAELIDLGFEHRLQQLYRRFEGGRSAWDFLRESWGWVYVISMQPLKAADYRPQTLAPGNQRRGSDRNR
jgi:hypothetical protein